jgi:hypothetical protein
VFSFAYFSLQKVKIICLLYSICVYKNETKSSFQHNMDSFFFFEKKRRPGAIRPAFSILQNFVSSSARPTCTKNFSLSSRAYFRVVFNLIIEMKKKMNNINNFLFIFSEFRHNFVATQIIQRKLMCASS